MEIGRDSTSTPSNECDEPGIARALDQISASSPDLNEVHILHDRLIPGSDCSLEHVVVANHAITVIRSSSKKGRVRIGKDTVRVGGSSLEIIIAGLNARVETVRHRVSGDIHVFGAIILSRQPNAELKHFGPMPIGSKDAVFVHLAEQHAAAEINPDLAAIAYELSGVFLRPETFEQDAA